MGAWIEIVKLSKILKVDIVAPYLGAWIEILQVTKLLRHLPVAPYSGSVECNNNQNVLRGVLFIQIFRKGE
nr:MAG TPA: hypothetical protein [Caudoviricetes sp.]